MYDMISYNSMIFNNIAAAKEDTGICKKVMI